MNPNLLMRSTSQPFGSRESIGCANNRSLLVRGGGGFRGSAAVVHVELVVGVQNHRHQVHQRKPVVLNLCTGQLYKPLTVFQDAFVNIKPSRKDFKL